MCARVRVCEQDYYESGNCRLEADYAWSLRSRGVHLEFAMMDPSYTTHSEPERVSGVSVCL